MHVDISTNLRFEIVNFIMKKFAAEIIEKYPQVHNTKVTEFFEKISRKRGLVASRLSMWRNHEKTLFDHENVKFKLPI